MNISENTLKTWARVNLDAIANNYNYIKSRASSRVIAVVKANAYGHGAVPVAKRLEKEGCDFFAVSSIEEALKLRHSGITADILVLGYVLPCHIEEAVENDISFACASLDFAKQLSALPLKKTARIHIKLNTGMNRTGFICRDSGFTDLEEAIEILKSSKSVSIEGVFSHFAKAEDDKAFSEKQCDLFKAAADLIKSYGISPSTLHICNSAGAYNYPSMHFNAVRAGIHLYGCEGDKSLTPAMDFMTRIIAIQQLSAGEGVSYGLDFIAESNMKIATIGAGYGDGIFRYLSSGKGKVIVNGHKCPIIGRVCMDMTMIDITDIPDACVGDAVTIWGAGLSAEEQASNADTISYELLCAVSPRVHRIYE